MVVNFELLRVGWRSDLKIICREYSHIIISIIVPFCLYKFLIFK